MSVHVVDLATYDLIHKKEIEEMRERLTDCIPQIFANGENKDQKTYRWRFKTPQVFSLLFFSGNGLQKEAATYDTAAEIVVVTDRECFIDVITIADSLSEKMSDSHEIYVYYDGMS